MTTIAADLFYLPNLEFFAAIWAADEVAFFPNDTYERKSFFNRSQILLSNKVETLSVPIVGRRPRIPQRDIRIDYGQKWHSKHLKSIQSAYGKAPFFEYFFPEFEAVFMRKTEFLWELNLELVTLCLRLLQQPVKMSICENQMDQQFDKDIRGQIKPSEHFSGRNYYQAHAYTQLFGLDFEPNLSIIDLLFCEGPMAKNILQESLKKH